MVRWIKLKEFDLGADAVMAPPEEYLANCDGSLPQDETRILVDGWGFMRSGAEAFDEDRVMLLGDSSAESLWMQCPDRLGAVIEARLRAHGSRCDVLMGAMSNCTTLHALNIFLNKCIPLRPRQLIYMSCGSDAEALCSDSAFWLNDPDKLLSPITHHEKGEDRPSRDAPDTQARWAMLRVLHEAADAHGTELVLVTVPYRRRIDAYMERYYRGDFAYHEKISAWKRDINACTRRFAEEHGVRLIDAEALSDEAGIFYDIVHLNAHGCARLGTLIADALHRHPEPAREVVPPEPVPVDRLHARLLRWAGRRLSGDPRQDLGWTVS